MFGFVLNNHRLATAALQILSLVGLGAPIALSLLTSKFGDAVEGACELTSVQSSAIRGCAVAILGNATGVCNYSNISLGAILHSGE